MAVTLFRPGSCPSVARGLGFCLPLLFFSGRRPKDRSLPACDRGRRVPAPRWEGRRVKAGAPTQETVSSGIPYAVYLMKYVGMQRYFFTNFCWKFVSRLLFSSWRCSFGTKVPVSQTVSGTLCLRTTFRRIPLPLSLGGEDSSNEASVGFGHVPACLRRLPPH